MTKAAGFPQRFVKEIAPLCRDGFHFYLRQFAFHIAKSFMYKVLGDVANKSDSPGELTNGF
ncbi:hypothetical protein MACH10_26530 [Thalassospira tepidiphila]|nr:hypothetical protein MACH10_26530 [Thalassospira tepidiphila]